MRKQESGLIIQISSVVARAAYPFLGIYNATKAAIDSLVESWQFELNPLGIDIVSVEPGAYPTEVGNKGMLPDNPALMEHYPSLQIKMEKMGEAFGNLFSGSDVPEAVLNLIQKPAGERPLRVVVDRYGEDIIRINEVSDIARLNILKNFGLSD